MLKYQSDLPIIFIHVPKTGGTSLREIFKDWYKDKLFLHYRDPEKDLDPKIYKLGKGTCVFGHFHKENGFPIQQSYPEVKQFITFLRDPFDTMVSRYYYVRKKGKNWEPKPPPLRMSLEEFLLTQNHGMLNHLPIDKNDNFREVLENLFVHIGITEKMSSSLSVMAGKLNKPVPKRIKHLNVGSRRRFFDSSLRKEYRKKNNFIYSIYEYALSLNS